ncbi:hypothetical protein [uncultured Dechloromonas sp.]|uniref:hypothetical protein n=1 Tax=uncultured Dechloromonas sp. TaxID=171719 RepID=UPI0025DCC04B|nr:hypothetical protein [uncultured Dechloromonas sp.]
MSCSASMTFFSLRGKTAIIAGGQGGIRMHFSGAPARHARGDAGTCLVRCSNPHRGAGGGGRGVLTAIARCALFNYLILLR